MDYFKNVILDLNNVKFGGIYAILNSVDNKLYVGSSNNICIRLKQHIGDLNKSKHYNIYLQNAWNKYKSENFKLILLERIDEEEKIISKEQFFIDILKACDRSFGYNISPKADRSSHNQETIEKIRQASLEHIDCINKLIEFNKAKKGQKLPKNHIDNIKHSLTVKYGPSLEKKIKIIELYCNGCKIKDIAKNYKISIPSIYKILHQNNIELNGSKFMNHMKINGKIISAKISHCNICGKQLCRSNHRRCKECYYNRNKIV